MEDNLMEITKAAFVAEGWSFAQYQEHLLVNPERNCIISLGVAIGGGPLYYTCLRYLDNSAFMHALGSGRGDTILSALRWTYANCGPFWVEALRPVILRLREPLLERKEMADSFLSEVFGEHPALETTYRSIHWAVAGNVEGGEVIDPVDVARSVLSCVAALNPTQRVLREKLHDLAALG